MALETQAERFARVVQETIRQLSSNEDGMLIMARLATYKVMPVERVRLAISTKDHTLLVNGKWFGEQSIPKRGYGLAHEMMHDLLDHCRWLAQQKPEHVTEGRIAADCVVYSILSRTKMHEWKGDLECVSPDQLGFPLHLTIDQYFSALLDQKKKREEEEQKRREQEQQEQEDDEDEDESDGCEGDEGSDGEDDGESSEDDEGDGGQLSLPSGDGGDDPGDSGLDDGTVPPSSGTGGDGDGSPAVGSDDAEECDAGTSGEGTGLNCNDLIPDDSPIDQTISGHSERTMIEAIKAAGVGGAGLSGVLEARKSASIDWKRQLDRFMELVQEKEEYSYATPSRRSLWRGIAMPGTRNTNEITSACVVLDVSGSVSDSAIESAISRISDFCTQLGREDFVCHLIQFSNGFQSHEEYTYRDMPLKKLDVTARGTTLIKGVFDYVENEHLDPKVMVVITDGDIYDLHLLVKRPEYPVLWLIDGNYSGFNQPFGSKVPIF